MKKQGRLLVIGVAALLLQGCASNTKQIGSVGDIQFYRVRSSNFTGPNFTALVTKQNDEVKIQQTFGGPGIGAATISAIGHVGAAAVLGTSFPGNVAEQVTVSGTANAQGTGGNASAAGSGGSSASGGGSFTPPGLINNPGHGNPHNP